MGIFRRDHGDASRPGQTGIPIDYTPGEAKALIAPLLDADPDELAGWVLVGVTKHAKIRHATTVDCPAAIVQMLARVLDRVSADLPHDHDHSTGAGS